jgi:hypothetical protein
MKYGQVKERGTHQQLIAKGGFYKTLVQRQLESGEDNIDEQHESDQEPDEIKTLNESEEVSRHISQSDLN